MKGRFTKYVLSICLIAGVPGWSGSAQEMTDAQILSAIKEQPYRAAACHSPYYAPQVIYTVAPSGYELIYLSHIGRHGSRFQTHGDQVYDAVVALLDSLHSAKCLTRQGDSLRLELTHMQQAHRNMNGMLTMRGSAEHNGIARRLSARCPSLFCQKDRKIVNCTSTTVQRTIQSMAAFVSGLGLADPSLDVRIGCGIDMIDFYRPEDKRMSRDSLDSIISDEEVIMTPDMALIEKLQSRLFVGYKASESILFEIFKAASSAGCLDIAVDPLRFFTPEEQFAFYKKRDVSFNAKYGTFAPVRLDVAKSGKKWVRLIVDDADKALDGNGHCADFRFAHDTNLGPMMNLLGIGGFAISSQEDAPYRYWQSFNQICMASNLQLEFYSNKMSDILVKALYNEKEVKFPGLEAVDEVYYKWNEVRRYMIGKCEDLREVPEYYDSYLEAKAKKIRRLQREEKDGFYFITDMHFPLNNGNAAALIERLQNMTQKRLIVFGGDAVSYVDDFDEALAMQISALEQMRGVSPILWARGNHDLVNYTGKKEWITKERYSMPRWESEGLLSHFRPIGTVSNDMDPYTTYCYYDNPEKKTRYVVFDTTDSVQDDKKQSGLSETQLKWIIEEAIMSAPKGFGLVFVSHIPFLGEGKNTHAKDALCAFSNHTTFKFADTVYDFNTRADLNMICVVCGHRHVEYSKEFPGGQHQINVMADCSYDYMNKTKGTTSEQCFEYISISKNGTVRTVRIGDGEDRTF